jgi:hypothetical protein
MMLNKDYRGRADSSFAILLKVFLFCGVIERRSGRVNGTATCLGNIVRADDRRRLLGTCTLMICAQELD